MKKLMIQAVCPHCEKSLNEGEWIGLLIEVEGQEKGEIKLSAYFGDYSVILPYPIEEGKIATFYCPHCNKELSTGNKCELCGAPLFRLKIKTGGYVDACTRKGCKGHAIGGFGDVDELMLLVNKLINSPFL